MNLSELEDICRKLEDISVKTQQKIGQVTDLEERSKQLKDEMELEKIRAEIRGEKPPEASSLEELEQARKELKELEGSREALKKDALTGMAKLDLPISKPETDSEGSVVFTLEGGPYERSVGFVAKQFDSSLPLNIDNVLIDTNKVVVTKVKKLTNELQKLKEGYQSITVFKQNIQRMAQIAMGEKNPEIENVVEYMRKGAYTDLWEAVGSKQKVVFKNLYTELSIIDSGGKTRVQNFFTNGRKLLGETFPFINTEPGEWQRTFFGSLVWRRYHTLYSSTKESPKISKEAEEKHEDEVEVRTRKTEPKIQPLNKYMETKELDKILYGNTGAEDANR
jgi:hypothetical protein